MKLIRASAAELKSILKDWTDRMELVTCRPVIEGKRIPESNEVVNYLYYEESISEPIGNIFYFNINERNLSCEFGYKINPNYRKKGFGKKMLKEFTSLLFSNTIFNKLYCQTASFNKPSVKMLERLGFKRDAVLREHHELDGKLYDDYVYSLLRSEWGS